jgi:hypothetical protein
MYCRFCNAELSHVFIDLIAAPASNSFLKKEQLHEPETYFPLKIFVCEKCFLVQVDEYKESTEIFTNDYVYFSSYSKTWVQHAKNYVDYMIDRFGISGQSQVVEIASNDGYLLQFFKEKKVPVLGIEPTGNTANVAIEKGIETITEFFGVALAKRLIQEGRKANLLLGNNVLAHVPDILDFVQGMKIFLAEDGLITMEFPHLVSLISNNQFDTIYHEHFSYLSFYTVNEIFSACDLTIFDVEELPTHGGSLRIYAKHPESYKTPVSERVNLMLEREKHIGVTNIKYYQNFQLQALKLKTEFILFLLEQKKSGKKVVGYGAAAKGNTLLNYCGVKNDLIEYVVDANPNKQNRWLPGSHIPVVSEEWLRKDKPDVVIIFPWNIKSEIIEQLSYIRDWNGKFLTPIPQIELN